MSIAASCGLAARCRRWGCGTRIRACTWRSRPRAASPTARTAARTSCWSTEPGRDGRQGMSRALTVVQLLPALERSEEHTSELQSLMRISYAVFCLKKKKKQHKDQQLQNAI